MKGTDWEIRFQIFQRNPCILTSTTPIPRNAVKDLLVTMVYGVEERKKEEERRRRKERKKKRRKKCREGFGGDVACRIVERENYYQRT